MTANSDELAEHQNVQQSLSKQVTTELDKLKDCLISRDKTIMELQEQLKTTNAELVGNSELINAYAKYEQDWKKEKDDLEGKHREVCMNRNNFREDAKNSRTIIDEQEKLIEQYEETLDELLCTLIGLSAPDVAKDEVSIAPLENIVPRATGVFICRGDEHYSSLGDKGFRRLKGLLPEIDFGEKPLLVLDKNTDRSPVPDVDIAILSTKGLSHTDGDALRDSIRVNNPRTFICTHLSTSLIVVDVRKWLKTGANFRTAETVA